MEWVGFFLVLGGLAIVWVVIPFVDGGRKDE